MLWGLRGPGVVPRLGQGAAGVGQAAVAVPRGVVPGHSAEGPTRPIRARSSRWRQQVQWGVMDLSGPYRETFTDALAHAGQVADPFHVIRLANSTIDDVRRRVQNETASGRGTKHDPLYRIRRPLLQAAERVTERGRPKLRGLLAAATPKARPATPGTPKKPSAAGTPQSSTGTAHRSPTAPPKQPTTSPSSSSGSRSGPPTSTTIAPESCSTPANPTGPSSTTSLHAKTRRAGNRVAQPGSLRVVVTMKVREHARCASVSSR